MIRNTGQGSRTAYRSRRLWSPGPYYFSGKVHTTSTIRQGKLGENMSLEQKVYLRLRYRVEVRPYQRLYLKDMAQIIAEHPELEARLARLTIHQIRPQDKQLLVIDLMRVIRQIKENHPHVEVEAIGPAQTIIEIIHPRKTPAFILVAFVWLLLFLGSGLAIMNFHEDVSMLQVHQKMYKIITGETKEYPLLLQIPYSIGIGLGMILFFNRLFKKRLNEEPSPLEVEMFLYQQNLDQYVAIHENKEAEKRLDEPD